MRARALKPALFKNELLGVADPLLTILFEGLWCEADREGRLEDRPLRIKAEVFPYRHNIDVDALLSWLHDNQFIARYTANGVKVIQILKFLDHQRPHSNEVASVLPALDASKFNQGEKQAQPRIEALRPSSLTPSSLTPDFPFLTADSCDIKLPTKVESVPHETEVEIYEHILTVKAKYPSGAAREDWIGAERSMRRLVDDGLATWEQFETGAERYRSHCNATGRWVLDPKNFFSAEDRPWSQSWPLPEKAQKTFRSAPTTEELEAREATRAVG